MRLFVAIPCPEPIVNALAPAMEGGPPALRWVAEEQLHCTLRFIGEVDRQSAEDVAEALVGIASPPLEVCVEGVGRFDHRGGGALWARIVPKAPLKALHEKIDRALQRVGLEPERRAYLPHVTLARWSGAVVDVRPWVERWAGMESSTVEITAFTLFESFLRPTGPPHAPLLDVPLHGSRNEDPLRRFDSP